MLFRLLVQWLHVSELQYAFSGLSLKYSLCAEPKAPVNRVVWARARESREAVHTDKWGHEQEQEQEQEQQ